jgi:phosphoribosylglycinamide formyltransferase-1
MPGLKPGLMPGSTSRWAIFISGRGSNLAAALDLKNQVDIACVVSSKASATGLLRAKRSGIPTYVLDRQIDWSKLDAHLRAIGVTQIFLLGFMRIVPAEFIALWPGAVVNLHPSLLPAYPGIDSIRRAHADGAPLGVTVHEVIFEVDQGEQILQRRCLKEGGACGYSLQAAEFQVHIDEQRLVKETLLRWKPKRRPA